jgi:hypothetical protein
MVLSGSFYEKSIQAYIKILSMPLMGNVELFAPIYLSEEKFYFTLKNFWSLLPLSKFPAPLLRKMHFVIRESFCAISDKSDERSWILLHLCAQAIKT